MKAVIQIVDGAQVDVDGETIGKVEAGMMILLGVMKDDTASDIETLVTKIVNMRTFKDESGKHFELGLAESGYSVLVVSQFTLGAEFKKGRRPDFCGAMSPVEAKELYLQFVARLREEGVHVETGEFGAYMRVSLLNDGPITYILDSHEL